MWDFGHICASVGDSLRSEAVRFDLEQSVTGIDTLSELALHPLIQQSLRDAGYGVHPEQRYPGHRTRPNRAEGDRCDIVLTERPDDHLLDPLASGTLFGARGAQPDEAMWLEVKSAHQFGVTDAGIGASRGYSGQLLTASMADVRKLASDVVILHAALLVIMFTADAPTASHDLDAWMHRCLDKGLPIDSPILESFPIADRIGNGACTIAVVRVRRAG